MVMTGPGQDHELIQGGGSAKCPKKGLGEGSLRRESLLDEGSEETCGGGGLFKGIFRPLSKFRIEEH